LRDEIFDVSHKHRLLVVKRQTDFVFGINCKEMAGQVDFTAYQLLGNEFLKRQAAEKNSEKIIAKFEAKLNEKDKELARIYARNASL